MNRQDEINDAAIFAARCKTADPDWQPWVADMFKRGANWADTHPHWISVQDELPEKDTVVLTHCNLSDMFGEETNLIGTALYDGNGFSGSICDPTHWMSLPEAPKNV